MNVRIMVNGQERPLGVNLSGVRLEVFTQEIENIVSVKYYVYAESKLCEPVFYYCSDALTAYISDGLLQECTVYHCKAEVFLHDETKLLSETTFETGISETGFAAQWVDNPLFDESVSEFEKEFTIDEEIKKARLYIVGLGLYESRINGERTDDDFYKPLLTDFDIRKGLDNSEYDEEGFRDGDKTICYATYDITHLLSKGKNKLSVLLGQGWYCNTDKTITDTSFSFGTPKLLFEIHLYGEGKRQVITSGTDCLVRRLPRKSQLYNGDFVDFTAQASEWIFARLCEKPTGRMIAPETALDKIQERISPVALQEYDEIEEYTFGEDHPPIKVKRCMKVLQYDFGKNHSGGVHLKVRGERGSHLRLRFYETKTNGVFNAQTSSCGLWDRQQGKYIGAITQTSEYILSGDVDEIYPLFHWDCYRYVTLECTGPMPEILFIQSLFICSDVKTDAGFECSDDFLNRLYQAFVLTQQDNMHCGVPSDCPHREKIPYTGDGQLTTEATLYCFDADNFYRKWLKDIIASQRKDGWIPYTAPYIVGAGGFWWSNALTVVPLCLYRYTGDKEIINSVLPAIFRLLEFYEQSHNGDYIIEKKPIAWLLGEWVTPDYMEVSVSYMNTLAYYTALEQTMEMCKLVGQEEQLNHLRELKAKVKEAINSTFFDKESLNYCKGVQGENLMPVINGIAEEDVVDAVWNQVVEHYKNKPYFDTGIVLTPVLLDALMIKGEKDLAYQILMAKEEPSYYAMLEDATTLREHFRLRHQNKDGSEGKYVSHSHPMFGSIIPWVVKHVAGLDLTELYAKKITIAPKFIDKINESYAYKNTRYGKVSVKYSAGDDFVMEVVVPHGCTANIVLPDEIVNKVKGYQPVVTGGRYKLSSQTWQKEGV